MSVDGWSRVGIVCGALLALIGLLMAVWRMVRGAWRMAQNVRDLAEALLGDKARGLPSIADRMEALERGQAEHAEWHAKVTQPNGRPSSVRQPRQ